VERILMRRNNRRVVEYLVKWKGYGGAEYNSWEPMSMLVDVKEHIHHFLHPNIFPPPNY
jgi:hypothetical protein